MTLIKRTLIFPQYRNGGFLFCSKMYNLQDTVHINVTSWNPTTTCVASQSRRSEP